MIFVDTSVIIALAIASDKFHEQAVNWRSSHLKEEYITSNLVFIETVGWIRYSGGKSLSVEVGKNLLSERKIRIERATIPDEQKAWSLFQKLEGRGLSIIDCTSFIIMKRLKIKQVFAFDADFEKQGFTVYPS